MSRPGISTAFAVAIVAVLVVAVGVGYYAVALRPGGTTTASTSSSSSSSTVQGIVCSSSQTATGNVVVNVADFSFSPANVAIKAGQSVQWVYTPSGSTQHEVASNTAGLFQSNPMSPGDKFTCTFNQVGVFAYHCMFHPTVMKGNVTVT